MQRSFNLLICVFLCLISLLLVYFSFTTFDTLAKLQKLVNKLNKNTHYQTLAQASNSKIEMLGEFEHLHLRLPWDADIGSMLITVVNNQIRETANKSQQHALASKLQNYYQQSLSLRPRDIQLLSGQLDMLIDQGAPVDYILPKLDKIISFVPKDQDLKSELAMICFKLLTLYPQTVEQKKIITSLQSLFVYSMDYRGLIDVRRYAKLYGQEDVLKNILATLN